jgi:hypothetical protein
MKPNSVQHARRALPTVSVVAAKLMLSIFTVFPQTIKAFSLEGVPATKFCAFIFFFASTTRLLIDLCGLEPEEPFTPPDDGDNVQDDIVLLVLLFQAPFQLWIWHNIIISAKFQLSDDFYFFCAWTSLACSMLLIIQLTIWLLYVVSRRRFDISASPHVVPVRAFWLFIMALSAVRNPNKQPQSQSKPQATIPPVPDTADKFVQAAGSMVCAILLSITVAKALDLIGRLFASQTDTTETTEGSTEAGENQANNHEGGTEGRKEDEKPSDEPAGSWLGRVGVIGDRWLLRFLLLHSTASVSITLTIFNLITTVMYYLIYFDGTGTVNPGWTSVLG